MLNYFQIQINIHFDKKIRSEGYEPVLKIIFV